MQVSLFNYCGRWCSHVQQSYSAQLCFICSFLFPLLKPSQGTIWFGRQRKQQTKFWPKLYSWPLMYTGLASVIGRMQITPLLNNNHMWHFSMIFNIDVLQKFKCAKLPSFCLAFCVSSRKNKIGISENSSYLMICPGIYLETSVTLLLYSWFWFLLHLPTKLTTANDIQ